MDGLSWTSPRASESFKRPSPAADTLNRLASFIARAESKQGTLKPPHTHHSQQAPPLSPLSPLSCQGGADSFPFPSELLHQEDHQPYPHEDPPEAPHALPKPHQCPGCGRGFSLRSSLQLHQCGSVEVYETLDPAADTNTETHCPHTIPDPYTCAPCGRCFSHKQALLHHQQAGCDGCMDDLPASPSVSEGDSSSSSSLDVAGPSGLNVCTFCSRTFRTDKAFQRHKLTSHLDETFKPTTTEKSGAYTRSKNMFTCRSCEMVFRSTTKLYLHRKEKHTREIKMAESRPPPRPSQRPPAVKHRKSSTYTCQICSKVFFHHLSLWAHKKKHPPADFNDVKRKSLPEKPLEKTDGRFVLSKPRARNKVWQKNILTETPPLTRSTEGEEVEEEELEFPCPSCPEVFALLSDLKTHVELHQSAVRRCRCSVCTNEMDSCKWPGSRKHRLYHCVPCQQGFSSLDAFLRHCQDHLRLKVEQDGLTDACV